MSTRWVQGLVVHDPKSGAYRKVNFFLVRCDVSGPKAGIGRPFNEAGEMFKNLQLSWDDTKFFWDPSDHEKEEEEDPFLLAPMHRALKTELATGVWPQIKDTCLAISTHSRRGEYWCAGAASVKFARLKCLKLAMAGVEVVLSGKNLGSMEETEDFSQEMFTILRQAKAGSPCPF